MVKNTRRRSISRHISIKSHRNQKKISTRKTAVHDMRFPSQYNILLLQSEAINDIGEYVRKKRNDSQLYYDLYSGIDLLVSHINENIEEKLDYIKNINEISEKYKKSAFLKLHALSVFIRKTGYDLFNKIKYDKLYKYKYYKLNQDVLQLTITIHKYLISFKNSVDSQLPASKNSSVNNTLADLIGRLNITF